MKRMAMVSTVLLLLALHPVAAAEQPDPVVADVIRMLEEGVPAVLVSDWLDSSGSRPGELGPDDLIAMTKADVPEDLIRKIMDLAAGPPAVAGPKEPDREVPDVPAGTTPGGRVPVEFRIDYEPEMVEYQMTPWDLFVYMDGRPLAWADGWSSHTSLHKNKLEFRQVLPAGRHVIRILQEQHTLKSKRKGEWRHDARAFTRPIILDLEEGGNWRVEIGVREKGSILGRKRVPVEVVVLRDGKVADRGPGGGPAASDWPSLCEEVKTAYSGKKAGSRAESRALEGCVSWDSLWEGIEEVPDRNTVREELRSLDFRPVPAVLE
jgi:hypothetical protein